MIAFFVILVTIPVVIRVARSQVSSYNPILSSLNFFFNIPTLVSARLTSRPCRACNEGLEKGFYQKKRYEKIRKACIPVVKSKTCLARALTPRIFFRIPRDLVVYLVHLYPEVSKEDC